MDPKQTNMGVGFDDDDDDDDDDKSIWKVGYCK
jgi:hypothetical protein